MEPVLPSLAPPSPTPTTPMCTPTSLPSPPQFVSEHPTPPSLPSTPPQVSLFEQVVMDNSYVLPPQPQSPTVFSEDDLDATLPVLPPELMYSEVINKPLHMKQIVHLMTATSAIPGVKYYV